ncbi:hypothetical protein KC980_04150, partial [candidate division WWE3 bacterium]|nr:hypothetical protein [candidate division WWE3 bacterium]
KDNGKELTMGIALSRILSYSKTDNQVMSWYLAKEIYKNEEVKLKAEEIIHLRNIINTTEVYAPIVTGQLLELIKE